METDNNSEIESRNKWNIRNLEPPPVTTYKASAAIDIADLRKSFEDAKEFFANQTCLKKEAKFLCRTVHKTRNKFRIEKGFKFMQKLNRSIQKYFELNFLSIIDSFYELLPKIVRSGSYLPTSNMLDYILVRLQGLTAIMNYIVETAKTAAHLMEARINNGDFWKMALFAYALLSRIWWLCRNVLDFSCKFYKEILPLRNILKKGSNSWLGDDYQFPLSLESWLNIEQIKAESPPKDLSTFTVYNQDESDVECLEEYTANELRIDDEHNGNHTNKLKTVPVLKVKSAFELLLEDEEVGEVVQNIELQTKKIKKKRKKGSKKVANEEVSAVSSLQVIESINSFKHLKVFIRNEKKLRKEDLSKSLYKNLDGLQWNMLQNKIKLFSKKAVVNKAKQTSLLCKAINMLKCML